jgi:hypothetical protein
MKPRTLMTFGMAVMSLTIASGFSPAFSATLTQLVFDEKTQFGFGGGCGYNPNVCELDGQGFLSGTIIYDASQIPIYPASGKPIFFEANWKGLVNSLPWQPNNINIKFQTSSVTRFNLHIDAVSSILLLLASMSDPQLPEFSAFDLHLQYDLLKSGNRPSIFRLETPLGLGSRILSEGVLELTEVKAVPEPVTIFGSGTALGLGLLASFRRRQSSRSSSLAGVPKTTD